MIFRNCAFLGFRLISVLDAAEHVFDKVEHVLGSTGRLFFVTSTPPPLDKNFVIVGWVPKIKKNSIALPKTIMTF